MIFPNAPAIKAIDSLSRSFIQKMVKESGVTVNDKVVKGSYRVKTEDRVSFLLPVTD